MKIVINDANILIDLYHLDLLELFFSIPNLELKTTDFVYDELYGDQKEILDNFIKKQSLIVIESYGADLISISQIYSSNKGLSLPDCSIWYHAKVSGGVLLTGDGKLRKQSSDDGIEVRGLMYVFDQLIISNLISFDLAIKKLNELKLYNDRLPKDAIKQRLDSWSRSKHVG